MKRKAVDFKQRVGQRVRALRNRAQLSQDVLSERCGIYRTYLSRIEGGRANPSLLVLVALASALNATVCDLFQEQEPLTPDHGEHG